MLHPPNVTSSTVEVPESAMNPPGDGGWRLRPWVPMPAPVATDTYHSASAHRQESGSDSTQLVTQLQDVTLGSGGSDSTPTQGDERGQRVRHKIPPWIPINKNDKPPLPPRPPSHYWTSYVQLGNVYISAVIDERFGPASTTTAQTPDQGQGQGQTGSVSRTGGSSDTQHASKRQQGAATSGQRGDNKDSKDETKDNAAKRQAKDSNVNKDARKVERFKDGKPRPCFVNWHLTRSQGVYIAPLLTSNSDPKKLRKRGGTTRTADVQLARLPVKPREDLHDDAERLVATGHLGATRVLCDTTETEPAAGLECYAEPRS
ncbi:hypothetical protein C8Q78DRAFT_9522 [Trametes maxima]|nr:hypothetical protein C8Q78DRAFT_9522 [Trametes maxima]